GDAEHFRARVVRTAKAGKPAGATAQNGRRNRDRLNVVHSRRAAIETSVRREWRLQARLALLAFEAFEQRRLFTADVSAGAMVDVDVEVPAGTAGVLADETSSVGFKNGLLQRLALENVFAAQVDVALVRAHRVRGNQAAFDQQ